MPIKNFIEQLFEGKDKDKGEAQKAMEKAKDFVLKEKAGETALEKPKKGLEEEIAEQKKEVQAQEGEISTKLPPLPPTPAVQDEDLKKDKQAVQEIERIMEEDLEEVYQRMDPNLQKKFKAKGEETATKICQLLKEFKIKAQTILELIKNWLKLVPGINKFFLEQEAKIKTDKILALKKVNKEE